MKKYNIEIDESQKEVLDYLQRLMLEVDSRLTIIDRLFETHKMDPDDSLFKSVPYKSYMKEFEEYNAQFNEAKNEFSKYLMPIIKEKEGKDEINFQWNVSDFVLRIVEITIL